MAELSEEVRLARSRSRKALLRAFNGAALGTVLGGPLGAALGCGFATALNSDVPWGIELGGAAGLVGGFWIGATVIIQDVRLAIAVGTCIGCLVALALMGFLYFMWLFGSFNPIGGSIGASGVIGGLSLSILFRFIRRRWDWWTRWEE